MSYVERESCLIKPKGSYQIERNCAKCNGKTKYINTNNFRVNANGKCVDIWLIYQCEKCKHTYNLPIYRRVRPASLDPKEYNKFLANDKDLAYEYGCRKELFLRNKAAIAQKEAEYDLIFSGERVNRKIRIENPYGVRVRVDKVIAELLQLSRSAIRKMIDQNEIICDQVEKLNKCYIGESIEVSILI